MIRERDSFGYIRLSRKMLSGEDVFWNEKREFSRAEAWIDLLGLASFSERLVVVGSSTTTLKRSPRPAARSTSGALRDDDTTACFTPRASSSSSKAIDPG